MSDVRDVRLQQLNDLEAEEARIMRELREMDEKANAETDENRRRVEDYDENPRSALSSLLMECEKEVRNAKGYIADEGPPLRIVRLRRAENGPKSATYLSRPRNTGVDFTVPVTLKAYTDLIKQPIFLNQIRDKIKQDKYVSAEDYLDDMRLLVRNTAQFNKGADLAWVVQHARFLLEAAEDAVTFRRQLFRDVEEALRQHLTQKQPRQNPPTLSSVGKRKRSHATEKTNGDRPPLPPVGSALEIYWPSYRKWYLAYITAHGDARTCHVRYDEDNSRQWITLDHERWRIRNSRTSTPAKASRASEQPAKRRKSGTAPPPITEQVVYTTPSVSPEDLDAFRIDVFAKFDDARDTMMEQLKDHFVRVDRAIIRSDSLSRVLVRIEDMEKNFQTFIDRMEKKFENLQRTLIESIAENKVSEHPVSAPKALQRHSNASNGRESEANVHDTEATDEPGDVTDKQKPSSPAEENSEKPSQDDTTKEGSTHFGANEDVGVDTQAPLEQSVVRSPPPKVARREEEEEPKKWKEVTSNDPKSGPLKEVVRDAAQSEGENNATVDGSAGRASPERDTEMVGVDADDGEEEPAPDKGGTADTAKPEAEPPQSPKSADDSKEASESKAAPRQEGSLNLIPRKDVTADDSAGRNLDESSESEQSDSSDEPDTFAGVAGKGPATRSEEPTQDKNRSVEVEKEPLKAAHEQEVHDKGEMSEERGTETNAVVDKAEDAATVDRNKKATLEITGHESSVEAPTSSGAGALRDSENEDGDEEKKMKSSEQQDTSMKDDDEVD